MDDDRYSHKAEAEATESKRTDATRPDAKPFPVCFRPGQFGAHGKGHAPGKRMKKDGMDDYTTRRIRLAFALVLCHCPGLLLLLLLSLLLLLASSVLPTYCYRLEHV